jgi:hypothetical protein
MPLWRYATNDGGSADLSYVLADGNRIWLETSESLTNIHNAVNEGLRGLLAPERESRRIANVPQWASLSLANNRSVQKLLCCNTFISVMKTAGLWNCDNLSNLQRLSRARTLLAEAQVGSRFMVVAEIRRQRSL